MAVPEISIVTVNFNQPQVTEALMQNLLNTACRRSYELIVVDNGSTHNPVPQWQDLYPQFTFIHSPQNLGFAGGNNLGIAAAKGKFLFLINNDTECTDYLADALADVLEQHPQIGLISPKILYWDAPTMVQYAGFTPMNYYTCRNAVIGQYEQDNGQYDLRLGPTAYPHGAAMMCRRDALERAGLMNPIFFLYYEELDWAEAFRQKGYEHWFCGHATIYHKESVSVGKKSRLKEYYMNRNRLLFIRRNGRWQHKLFFWCYNLFIVFPRNILVYVKEGNTTFIPAIFKALWWNITHRPGR